MFLNKTGNVLTDLLELNDSTTLYLESLCGNRLQLTVESQEELPGHPGPMIKREVKLYFTSPEMPVLYCVSYLNKSKLTDKEYSLLREGSLPIGIIFQCYNDPAAIHKINMSVTRERNPIVAHLLGVGSDLIFNKRYDYRVTDRAIGYICEYFNEESLGRI